MGGTMPGLARSEWYDLTRDMSWTLSYVDQEEADAVSTAIQLNFTFETGFTNLQFLGMAADAMNVGDLDFGALISSIQTDEARHSQQGEPTIKILVENGKGAIAQKLVDQMF